ncbi:MAG: hypothetical protein C4K47_07430 [Candidatus Thorarchaeota archaeon]|nr:MAG: hypothetical protein C4K47_07430 [Candidatus Thorarchaeota archaeon]
MSDEVPERREVVRSTVVSVILAVVFLILAIALWAWSAPGLVSPVSYLNSINPYISVVLEILAMFGFFVFITVTVVNLRLGLTEIRAGWTEVVTTIVLVTIVSWAMFGASISGASLILSLAFVVYLYLLQD